MKNLIIIIYKNYKICSKIVNTQLKARHWRTMLMIIRTFQNRFSCPPILSHVQKKKSKIGNSILRKLKEMIFKWMTRVETSSILSKIPKFWKKTSFSFKKRRMFTEFTENANHRISNVFCNRILIIRFWNGKGKDSVSFVSTFREETNLIMEIFVLNKK